MNRRKLIKGLVGLPTFVPHNLKVQAQAKNDSLLLQQLPLAGFQFYQGDAHWKQLRDGQNLSLQCDAGNRYDERTVDVSWQNQNLGYIKYIDYDAISQLHDRGQYLSARLSHLKQSHNPW